MKGRMNDPVPYTYRDVFIEEAMRRIIRESRKQNPVRHQETCPRCGRKNVNVYLESGEWLCKKCIDEATAAKNAALKGEW